MKRWNGLQVKWNKKAWTLLGVALLLCGAIVANFVIGNRAGGRGRAGFRAERGPGRRIDRRDGDE